MTRCPINPFDKYAVEQTNICSGSALATGNSVDAAKFITAHIGNFDSAAWNAIGGNPPAMEDLVAASEAGHSGLLGFDLNQSILPALLAG